MRVSWVVLPTLDLPEDWFIHARNLTALGFVFSTKAMRICVSRDCGMFTLDHSLVGNLDAASGELS